MVKKDLLDIGIDEKFIDDILNLYKNSNDIEIEQLKCENLRLKNTNIIDTAILKAGGRNVKAIKSLFDSDIIESDICIDSINQIISEIKKTDSYLFDTVENKNIGTGSPKGSNTNKNKQSFSDKIINSARLAAGLK